MGPLPGPAERAELLHQMEEVPGRLRAAVAGLSNEQLDTPYRPVGWTVRQMVHHLADADMNWYVRTKLALTQEAPVISPYDEARWAELADARTQPVEGSLVLLDGLRRRWASLFRSLSEEQWKRTMIHPGRGTLALDMTLAMHAWHGRHHTAQIQSLRARMNWR